MSSVIIILLLYQVEEFSKAAYIKQLTAIHVESHGFLIVWRWVEQEEENEEDPEREMLATSKGKVKACRLNPTWKMKHPHS